MIAAAEKAGVPLVLVADDRAPVAAAVVDDVDLPVAMPERCSDVSVEGRISVRRLIGAVHANGQTQPKNSAANSMASHTPDLK